jgi:hypothetical protein
MLRSKRPLRALIAVFGVIVAVAAFAGPASALDPPYPPAGQTGTVSDQTPGEGDSFMLGGSGFDANEKIANVLHSDPYTLAPAVANASGNFSVSVTLPAGTTGVHTIVSTGATSGHTSTVTITIGGTGAADDDSLAATGATVISIGSLALLLLVGGVLMVFSSRRRKVNS